VRGEVVDRIVGCDKLGSRSSILARAIVCQSWDSGCATMDGGDAKLEFSLTTNT